MEARACVSLGLQPPSASSPLTREPPQLSVFCKASRELRTMTGKWGGGGIKTCGVSMCPYASLHSTSEVAMWILDKQLKPFMTTSESSKFFQSGRGLLKFQIREM